MYQNSIPVNWLNRVELSVITFLMKICILIKAKPRERLKEKILTEEF